MAPRLIARFRADHPNVGVTMNDFSSHEQVELLRRDALDLGFVRLPVPAEFEALPLASDQLAIASPARIEIRAGGDPVQALADHDFVALRDGRGPGLSAQIRDWCRASDFHPKIVQEADDIQTVLALVAAGLGCAIVPASSSALLPGRLTLTPIAGEAARWTVGAVWKSSRNFGALAGLVRILRAAEEAET
ncbi:LysR family substrate-binding domain-containing protein [Allosphingosinicella deserti]|uniref:LysR family substrate-binding domain-containing protein n=1 Tax=Allosphingosinicella deserti TaxID=2116704 RepID=UPI002FCE230A